MRTTIRRFDTGDWCVYTSEGKYAKRRLVKPTQGGRPWGAVLKLLSVKQKENELDILRAKAVDATVPKTPNGKPHNVPSTIHRPKVTA